jgi:DNA phosphorothioation-dependent restriction protein DptG
MNLLDQIYALENTKPESRNVINTYLPFRNKGNSLDYSSVAGSVLELLLGKRLKNFDIERFKAACLEEVRSRLTDESVLEHVNKMYFENDTLLRISPEFLLLGRLQKEAAASRHLSGIFRSFLAQQLEYRKLEGKANFIERLFLEILRDHLEDITIPPSEVPYLPFIARLFVRDLTFLTQKADYMLEQLGSFLELYNFLYCAQLALNIREWEHGEPQSRPLYFILDTEKASLERTYVQNYGYKSLYSSVGSVFPILSMLETLNRNEKTGFSKQPLWQYAEAIQQASLFEQQRAQQALNIFAEEFRKNRPALKSRSEPHLDALGALRTLFRYALDQFKDYGVGTRHGIRDKYQKEFELHIARHFVQSRGRSGKVLVMTQDYLMLLTNLAIGANQQLRFQELLNKFRARGVYFDKQSEQSLIAFYERVGNADRKSDSGDAVYVKSTT